MRPGDTPVDCTWVRERIDDFVDGSDGDLTAAERAAVARHTSACSACRTEIDAAAAILRELRAFPTHEAPAALVAAAEAAIEGEGVLAPRRAAGALRWIPSLAAAAALVALVATARWSGPAPTESIGLSEARVERAAREAMFALSYVNRYARMTGRIVADEVLEKRLMGTMGRALDHEVIDQGIAPPLRRALQKSGFVETLPPHERS